MRDIIDRLRNDEPKFRLNSDAAHEIERLRADLADCRMLLGKYGDTAQELRVACDEKQRCIDSSVAAQREFLAVIDLLRAELTELRKPDCFRCAYWFACRTLIKDDCGGGDKFVPKRDPVRLYEKEGKV